MTNLHRGRLKADQILSVVRSHWAIENNGNWTMEYVWDEDTKTWCGQGVGIQVLGLLRLMAYNLVSLLRCRYLRRRDETRAERRRWEELLGCAVAPHQSSRSCSLPLPPGNRRHLTPPAGRRSSLREGELFDKNTCRHPTEPRTGRSRAGWGDV